MIHHRQQSKFYNYISCIVYPTCTLCYTNYPVWFESVAYIQCLRPLRVPCLWVSDFRNISIHLWQHRLVVYFRYFEWYSVLVNALIDWMSIGEIWPFICHCFGNVPWLNGHWLKCAGYCAFWRCDVNWSLCVCLICKCVIGCTCDWSMSFSDEWVIISIPNNN